MKGRSGMVIFGIITITAKDNTGAQRDLVGKAKLRPPEPIFPNSRISVIKNGKISRDQVPKARVPR